LNTGIRIARIREIAGAVWSVAAAVFMICMGILAATLATGAIHLIYKGW
jgi:hypothetical protein